MTIRKATAADLDSVTKIYNDIHTLEEAGKVVIGWNRSIYPTRRTAEKAVADGELFVLEEDGNVLASCRINRKQEPAYADVQWLYQAEDAQVMVMHTLTVSPEAQGRGFGPAMEAFYESYAAGQGCAVLRIDTNQRNIRARNMYGRLGYREAGIIPTTFNGIAGVQLVCLEKKL